MKKVLAMLLSSLMLVAMLVACGGGSSSSTPPASGGSSTSTSQGGDSGEKALVYVIIKNRGDLSYWDGIAEGGDRAATELADKADVRVIETTADLQANLTAMYEAADAGADLIITASDFKDNLVQVANEYPDIAFCIIAEDVIDQAENGNVYGIDFRTSEAAFLGGIVAADIASQNIEGTSGSKVIGFIGGMDESLAIQEYFLGYIQGAKYYDPDIKIVYNYVGGWNDPDTARTQALAQFNDAGAEVIFACAGGSGNGVHTAAAEVGKYVVGVDMDQTLLYDADPDIQSRFVTSVVKLLGNGVFNTISNFLDNGTLPFGEYEILGLESNAVGLIENGLFDEYVSDAGKAKLEEGSKAVADGSVTVDSALGKEQDEIKALIDQHINA